MKIRIIATMAVTAALLSTGAVAASAAPVSEPAPTSNCQFGEHLLHVWLRLPTDLRGDLKGLRALDPADRGAAAKAIREHARNHRLAVIERLPQKLKSDLVDLRAADQSDREAKAQVIAQAALDGGYGAPAQKIAERVQASDAWQACVAG